MAVTSHFRDIHVVYQCFCTIKYVKYTATMTYGNWPNRTFAFFLHHHLLLQLNWPTAKVAQILSMVLTQNGSFHNNNMCNPSLHFISWGYASLLLLHAIIHCLHTRIVCGSVNSEFQTIYVSNVWSYHNQLFTMHHSDYYLVYLIFGTTI